MKVMLIEIGEHFFKKTPNSLVNSLDSKEIFFNIFLKSFRKSLAGSKIINIVPSTIVIVIQKKFTKMKNQKNRNRNLKNMSYCHNINIIREF